MSSMLESLRERIKNAIQNELPTGLRDLRLSSPTTIPNLVESTSIISTPISSSSSPLKTPSSLSTMKAAIKNGVKRRKEKFFMGIPELKNEDINQSSGKELMEYFQNIWCDQQSANIENCRLANVIWNELQFGFERIQRKHQIFYTFTNNSTELMPILKTLTDIENEINKCFRLCTSLEDAITDLDKEFESIDFRMKQQESEIKLSGLFKRREDDLIIFKAQMDALNEQKIKQKALKEAEICLERQRVFQEVFEEEIARYKSGTLPIKKDLTIEERQTELLNIDIANDDEVAALEDFLAN